MSDEYEDEYEDDELEDEESPYDYGQKIINPILSAPPTPTRHLRWNLAQEQDGSTSISAHITGYGMQVADKSHSNFDQIKKFLQAEDHSDMTFEEQELRLLELFDLVFTIGKKFQHIGDGELLTVSGNRIFYDGDEINSALTDAILKFVKEGKDDWKPLVAFFEKMALNPNPDSVAQLYDWLQGGSWSICDDGDFIGYKGVDPNFDSCHKSGAAMVDGVWVRGAIPNLPGSVIEMPRSEVRNDPGNACAEGLHIGTFQFAQDFGTTVVSCKINPRNVVSVPNHERTKLRVCKYVVVEQVDHEGNSIIHEKPEDAKATYDNDDKFAKYVDYKKADFEEMGTREMRKLNKSWKVGTVRTKKSEMVDRLTAEAKRRRKAAPNQ